MMLSSFLTLTSALFAFRRSSQTLYLKPSSSSSSSSLNHSKFHNRRDILSSSTTSLSVWLLLGSMTAVPEQTFAFDAVTDDAIMVTKKLASPSALRSVKQVARKLAKLEDLVNASNYEDVRLSLRVVPFTDVRKNANTIIGGLPEEQNGSLKESYAIFIQGLEKMDAQASLGQRGRKNVDMRPGYDEAVVGLDKFIAEAEKNSDVPVKYEQDTASPTVESN